MSGKETAHQQPTGFTQQKAPLPLVHSSKSLCPELQKLQNTASSREVSLCRGVGTFGFKLFLGKLFAFKIGLALYLLWYLKKQQALPSILG